MIIEINAYYVILFFSILTIFSSCKGQNVAEVTKAGINEEQSHEVSTGTIVSEIEGRVMVIFQDSQDNYWFGGNENGVYKYDGQSLVLFSSEDGLTGNGVLGIQEDKWGNIYFDSEDAVSKFNGKQFTIIKKIESSDNEWKLGVDDLWFRGNWSDNGVYRYDGKALYGLKFSDHEQEETFNSKYPNASFSPYGVYIIYKDTRGYVWFGTSTLGVGRYNGKSMDWIAEEELMELDDGPAPGVRAIMEDKDGNFWFSNNILNRYRVYQKESTSRQEAFTYNILNGINASKKEGLNTYFMSIAEGDNGDIWMVTYDDGVWRYDGINFTHFPIKDGEKRITLFSIYKDKHGDLWIGSHKSGTYKFNGKTFDKFSP